MIFFIIVKYGGQRKEKIHIFPVFREKTAIFAAKLPQNRIFVFCCSPLLALLSISGRPGIYHDQSFFPACRGEPPNHFPFVFICCRGRISAEAIGEMRNNGPGGRPSISHLGSAKISVIEKQASVSHTPVFLSAIFAYCFRSSSTILRMTAGLPWPPAAPIVCPMRACIACTFPER